MTGRAPLEHTFPMSTNWALKAWRRIVIGGNLPVPGWPQGPVQVRSRDVARAVVTTAGDEAPFDRQLAMAEARRMFREIGLRSRDGYYVLPKLALARETANWPTATEWGERAWRAIVRAGDAAVPGWDGPVEVPFETLINFATKYTDPGEPESVRGGEVSLGRAIRRLCPSAKKVRTRRGGRLISVYHLPSLDDAMDEECAAVGSSTGGELTSPRGPR